MREIAGDIIRFSNNTAGMEKILKFLIGALILPRTPTFKSVSPFTHRMSCKFEKVSKELSVARKIVKFLYVLDAGLKAMEARKGAKGGPLKWFIVGKWACAFVYAASEAVTILHSMRVLSNIKSKWAHSANRKGNKFYFLSICFSILASAYQLWEITVAQHRIKRERRRIKAQKMAMAASVGTATAYASHHHHHHSSSSSSSDFSSSDYTSSSSSSEEEKVVYHRRKSSHISPLAAASSPISSGGSSVASPTLNPAILSAEAKLANAAEWERKKLFVDAARTSGTRNEDRPKTGYIVTQLLADICDLAIPASKVGWYKNKEAVGLAYVLSSLLAGSVIWSRVNAKTSTGERKGSHPGITMVRRDEYEISRREEERRRAAYEVRLEEERRKSEHHGHGKMAAAAGVGLAAGLAAGAYASGGSSKTEHHKTEHHSSHSTYSSSVNLVDNTKTSSSSHGYGKMAAAAGVGLAAGMAAGKLTSGGSSSNVNTACSTSNTNTNAGYSNATYNAQYGNTATAVGAGVAAGVAAGALSTGGGSNAEWSQSGSTYVNSSQIEQHQFDGSYSQSAVNATTAGIAAGVAAGTMAANSGNCQAGGNFQAGGGSNFQAGYSGYGRIEGEGMGAGYGHAAATATGAGIAAGMAAGAYAAGTSGSKTEWSQSESSFATSARIEEEERRRRHSGYGQAATAVGAGLAAGAAVGALAAKHERAKSETRISGSAHIEGRRRSSSSSGSDHEKRRIAAAAGLGIAAAGAYAASKHERSKSEAGFHASGQYEERRKSSSASKSERRKSDARGRWGTAAGATLVAGSLGARKKSKRDGSSSSSSSSNKSSSSSSSDSDGEGKKKGKGKGKGKLAAAAGLTAAGAFGSSTIERTKSEASLVDVAAHLDDHASLSRTHSVSGRLEDSYSSYQREFEQQQEIDRERLGRSTSTAGVTVDVDISSGISGGAAAAAAAASAKKRTGYGGWSYDDDGSAGALAETNWTQNSGQYKAEIKNTGVLEGRTGEIVRDLGIVTSGDATHHDIDELTRQIKNAKDASDRDVAAGGTGQLRYSTESGGYTTSAEVHRYETRETRTYEDSREY